MSQQDLKRSLRRLAKQPAFIAAAIILAIGAVSLNASVRYLKLHFKKEPVPMARALGAIPRDLGPWQLVSIDEPLDPEVEHALATKEYIFRDYMDTRLIARETIDQIRKLNESIVKAATADEAAEVEKQRATLVQQVRMSHPKGVVNLAVTYYTGLVDTVAHVPDRCYVADGYEPKTWEEVNWNIDDGKPVEVRYINFEDGTGRSSLTRSVAYFFHVNGNFQSSPEAVRVMTDFLSNALPEVRKSLPDWEAVKSGGKGAVELAAK